MLTAKGIKGSVAKKQLDKYAKANGFTPAQKAALTKKFLKNASENYLTELPDYICVSGAFIWKETEEGQLFWQKVAVDL